MKTLNLLLALSAPAMLAAGYMPESYNNQYISEISSPVNVFADDNFRLPKQPYYGELFSKKELKKLAKAEKQRSKSSEAMVMAMAIKKEAEDLRKANPEATKKIDKQIAKLEAKAAQQELNALKCFEKAVDIYRVVYTNELNNKTFSASTISEKTAQNLALEAQNYYQSADNLKETMTSENTLEVYRGMYVRHMDAVQDQELAFAIYKGDQAVDYTKYLNANRLDTTDAGNIAKENIPTLIAKEHYDFDKDTNVYRLRIHQLEDKLKLSDEDKNAVMKLEADEANSVTLFQKAEKLGCTADTFRVYAGESTTLAEKEYYEQKAQENELNECSNLLKAVKLEVSSNNKLYEIYKKYIPNIRDEKNEVARNFEEQAESLYNLSNTYEAMAAKQMSHVEQYTQLSEGNEVKLQAIQSMENAIASYLGEQVGADRMSLASGASEKHNDIPMDFNMDESDGEPQKVAAAGSTPTSSKPAQNTAKPSQSTTKTSNGKTSQPARQQAQANKTGKPASQQNAKPAAASKGEKVPAMASSNAAVVSTSYYTRDDQRMKPYNFPKGTIFSVEAGIYKEMVEPVEFPAVDNFIAQNLKGIAPMRYYIGDFKTYDAAYATLATAQSEGYKKAKVVAFVNGKPSDVATAKQNAEKAANYQQLVQAELKKINANKSVTTPVAPVETRTATGAAIPLTELPAGTSYAVQISSVPTLLGRDAFNVSDLYYDRNDAGLYRYYTGVSTDMSIASANLQIMKQSGFEDAYLVRVVNGKNQGAASAKPAATDSNNGVVYRIQVGAFKSTPADKDNAMVKKVKADGYAAHLSKSGEYTILSVGDCFNYDDAEKLRKQLAAKGYAGCYVAKFVNGVKQN